ncbi:hypothetical protein F7734_08180 [Scytonema sp. UIC 10036]|uniref:hypothetical protein n=1 Tax=Scytonema sp. UIC 10036 TaxID=2304196 RepID=UPI0012DA9CF2|nr:hypothetical protein [Scytonema sp. UIC 10036]MUG92435.1 hypothetical protein [Scytonema sp. UIC 10036]
MKRFWLVVSALLLGILLWGGILSNTVSSQQYDSRVSNLEADLSRLETRVIRIESLLSQNRRVPPVSTPKTPSTSSQARRTLPPEDRDRIFDRLATLVVELKQQVNALEGRVAKLEKR